jgi:hypothetical protein
MGRRSRAWTLLVAAAAAVGAAATVGGTQPARAADDAATTSREFATDEILPPVKPLHLQDVPESVYDLEAPPVPDQGVNEGGVNFDLTFRYLTDYVFRGIDRSEGNGGFNDDHGRPIVFDSNPNPKPGAEDAPNLQVDTRLQFDLGRLPSPFVGLFANVFNDDPINRFQEIRPYFGLEWRIRPFIVAGGHTNYIFPERDPANTAEVWASLTLDDSSLWHTDHPVLMPYVFAAYDYDLYDGTYIEAGLKHEMAIENTALTFTFVADVAYVLNDKQFTFDHGQDTGFQHYDIGLIGRYNLNTALNISRRYGTFALEGYLYYTNGIDIDLIAETQIWGGIGLSFHY